MKKIGYVVLCFALATLIVTGCSQEMPSQFQNNNLAAPFDLFHLFDDYPALKYAWDSVPGDVGNQKMAEMMRSDIPGTTEFLSILSYLLLKADNPGLGLLDNMKAALNLMVDENQRFYSNTDIESFYAKDSPATMMRNFYGFLDELARDTGGTTPKVHTSVIGIMNKVLDYLYTVKTEDDMQEFIEKLHMPTFYADKDYNNGNPGVRVKEGSYNLPITGIDDKSISSMKVPFGYKVALYANKDCAGTSLNTDYWEFDSNEPNLSIKGCDNVASSIKIVKDYSTLADLVEFAAQPMALGDYPMFITEGATPAQDSLITDYSAMTSGKNSGLGNMSQGMRDLMYGMILLFNGETVDRTFMNKQIDSLFAALEDEETIKKLVWNMSNYFTKGGSLYGTDKSTANEVYPADPKLEYSTDGSQLYSDAEFRETMRETLAAISGLLMRDDRRSSNTWYDGTNSQEYPLASFFKNVKKLYINWDNAQIKESIYDSIRYDMYGRDRKDSSSGAFATSILEHLLYLGAIAGNYGYEWKRNTNEMYELDTSDPKYLFNKFQREHGHGKHTGYLTLNDSFFSLQLQDDQTTIGNLSLYQEAFDNGDPDGDGTPNPGVVPVNTPNLNQKMNVFRSVNSFNADPVSTPSSMDKYQYIFSANYPVLRCLNGPSAGDYGVPDGGNPNPTGSAPGQDQYAPYVPNGKGMMDVSSWGFAHVVRACWEGEGPYYSTQGAVQGGNTFTYYRPDGTVYAYVDKTDPSNPIYRYPVSSDYDKEDPQKPGQRWNRYKDSWNTDNYVIRTDSINQGQSQSLNTSQIIPFEKIIQYWAPTDVDGDARADITFGSIQLAGRIYPNSRRIVCSHTNFNSAAHGIPSSGVNSLCNGMSISAEELSPSGETFVSSDVIQANTYILSLVDNVDCGRCRSYTDSSGPPDTCIDKPPCAVPQGSDMGTNGPTNWGGSPTMTKPTTNYDPANPENFKNIKFTFSIQLNGTTQLGIPIINDIQRPTDLSDDPLDTKYLSNGDLLILENRVHEGMIVQGPGLSTPEPKIKSITRDSSGFIISIVLTENVILDSGGPKKFTFVNASTSRTYYEIIPENSPDRECTSIEEAMFRNFQWVMNEKKMVLIVPQYIYLNNKNTIMGPVKIESALYQIIEGNGITGLSTARRSRDNGVWVKANKGDTSDASCKRENTSAIPGDFRVTVLASPTRDVKYNPSTRISIPSRGMGTTAVNNTVIDSFRVYWGVLGNGSATPGAIAHNIFALSRLGFPRSPFYTTAPTNNNYEHYLLGSQKVDNNDAGSTDLGFKTSDSVWAKRNSLLPMLIALMAPLREKSYYKSATENNNALAKMLEGLKFLIKPTVYFNYNIDTGGTFDGVAENCWLPRIMGPRTFLFFNQDWPPVSATQPYLATHAQSLISDWDINGFVGSSYDFDNDEPVQVDNTKSWYGGDAVRKYYRPAEIPTMLSILIDSDTSSTRSQRSMRGDGLLARMVSYDPTAGTGRPAADETPLEYKVPNMTAINSICAGLEQLTSGIKGQPARGTQIDNMLTTHTSPPPLNLPVKQLAVPQWRFEHRVRSDDPSKWADINLDKMLNKLKGGDDGNDNTKGLNRFHDLSPTYGDGSGDPDFTDITDLVSDIVDLMAKFVIQPGHAGSLHEGQYSLSEELFNILDVMAQHTVTPEQVKGLQYALAKMLAYYDASAQPSPKWMLQGDDGFKVLFDLLTTSISTIDAEMGNYADLNGKTKGNIFKSLVHSMQNVAKENGMMPFILDYVNIGPYSSGDVLTELNQWMASDLVNGPYTKFYSALSDMLEDMSDTVSMAPNEETLQQIYEQYGFQAN
jgi:hypothetical protein